MSFDYFKFNHTIHHYYSIFHFLFSSFFFFIIFIFFRIHRRSVSLPIRSHCLTIFESSKTSNIFGSRRSVNSFSFLRCINTIRTAPHSSTMQRRKIIHTFDSPFDSLASFSPPRDAVSQRGKVAYARELWSADSFARFGAPRGSTQARTSAQTNEILTMTIQFVACIHCVRISLEISKFGARFFDSSFSPESWNLRVSMRAKFVFFGCR